ncbi:hypothetical protein WOLCODRAFT_120355 [Wolfiporia cocos MD-104 SS10]|uniref:F-box domain-containing protein n=1 Tax=Wolfiporia cocos (strain MD-104) TaxID=742152 RepID=A0A2H3JKE6_WOLCO|nr:hypothetical protein WOLCODRAFT_120355 [Wolfiporia cocos MD-104 SS10]
MDSEDEAQLAQEKKKLFSVHVPALRLYEDEEREAKILAYRQYWREIEERNNTGDEMPHDDVSRLAHYDSSSFYRVSRFLKSFIRFHEGSLDLSGRSERRYSSLRKRVIAFLQDVELIQRHATRHEQRIQIPLRFEHVLVHYVVDPAHILKDFEEKYRLSNVHTFLDDIFTNADRCRALLQAETAPILQQKYLTDLPPELIHRIMDVSEVTEARLLGATCREFHEISRAYAFQTRSLTLGKTLHRHDDTKADAMHYRERFQSELDFLLSRADILQRIRDLRISSSWDDDSLERADLAPGSPAHEDFFAPVKRGILRVFNGTNNLLQLHLDQLDITRSMISAMSSMHALSTLSLSGCRLGSHLRSWSRAPQLPQVVNATFTLFYPAHYDSLHVLRILPNVQKLTLVGLGYNDWAIPESVILLCNPFRTAKRVFISDYADTDEDILMLAAWIAAASQGPGQRLPLTHFKLEVKRGIRQHVLITLLSALHGAPLTALSLVGLSYVGQELFENLASAFPDLGALTLVHRQNDLQRRNGPSVWPGTTWEYAARLAGFANLRYFGWNFDIRPVLVDVMCNLPLAEKNDEEAKSLLLFQEPVDYASDWQSLARLFLVYCPMLERLLFISDTTSQLECIITKDQSGKITIDTDTFTYVHQDYYKEVNPRSGV